MFKKEEAAAILERDETDPFPTRAAKLFFSISYYTGFSTAVTRELTWAAVDEAAGVIEGGSKKRPLTSALKNSLLELKVTSERENSSSPGSDTLLFSDHQGRPFSEEWILYSFGQTMENVGIDYQKRKLTPDSFSQTYNFWYA